MKHVGHFFRHQFLELLNHIKFWIIGALLLVFARATPEDMIAKLIEKIPDAVRDLWPAFLDFRTTITIVAVLIILIDLAHRRLSDARLRRQAEAQRRAEKITADLEVEQADDMHVARIRLKIHNHGLTPEPITRLEFLTKGHWDIASPSVHTTNLPVLPRLGKASFVVISPTIDSRSIRAIAVALQPGVDYSTEFFLVTNNVPASAHGIFPFHLGCELIHGLNDTRLPLPDLIVSLHGQFAAAQSVYDSIVDPLHVPGQPQSFANEALGRANPDVILPSNVRAALELAARVNTLGASTKSGAQRSQ